MQKVSFSGKSGSNYAFQARDPAANWAKERGVAVFPTKTSFGWRVVGVSSLRGRDHDVQPIWRYAQARRFGANRVFVCPEHDTRRRSDITADIHGSLTALYSIGQDALPRAA